MLPIPLSPFLPQDPLCQCRTQTHIDWILGDVGHYNSGVTLPLLCWGGGKGRSGVWTRRDPIPASSLRPRDLAPIPSSLRLGVQVSSLLPQTQKFGLPALPPSDPVSTWGFLGSKLTIDGLGTRFGGSSWSVKKKKKSKRGHGNWEQIMGVKCHGEPCWVLSRGGQDIAGCH